MLSGATDSSGENRICTGAERKGRRTEASNLWPIWVVALIGTTLAAILWPPVYYHLAGTDASNYANAAEQYLHGRQAGRSVLPPEITDATVRSSISERVLRDSRGMLTPYVFAHPDLTFNHAHSHLTPRVSALISAVGLDSWTGYLNYAFLGLSAVLLGRFVIQIGYGRAAALVATALFLLVPSNIELARYPMSEPLSVTLVLCCLVMASNPRTARSAIPALPLLALPHARSEFILVLLLAVVALSVSQPRGWFPMVAALIGSSWMDLSNSALHTGFGALSFSFEPEMSWPDPSTLLTLIVDLDQIPEFILPIALVSTLGGMWPAFHAKARLLGNTLGRFASSYPWIIVVGLIATAVVTDVYKSSLEPGEVILGTLKESRYQTSWLVWDSAGPVLTLLGLVGLGLAIPVLVERVGTIGWLVVIPLLGVLIYMYASPENPLWWTRRLQLIVYPSLIVGVTGFFAHAVASHDGERTQWGHQARIATLAALVLSSHVAATSAAFPDIQDGYLDAAVTEAMHDGFGKLPGESVVLLNSDPWGQKALAPARSFYGLYAFVVWDSSDLDGLLATFKRYDRALFVDKQLAVEAGWRSVSAQSFSVPVMETSTRGRKIQLHRVGDFPAAGRAGSGRSL